MPTQLVDESAGHHLRAILAQGNLSTTDLPATIAAGFQNQEGLHGLGHESVNHGHADDTNVTGPDTETTIEAIEELVNDRPMLPVLSNHLAQHDDPLGNSNHDDQLLVLTNGNLYDIVQRQNKEIARLQTQLDTSATSQASMQAAMQGYSAQLVRLQLRAYRANAQEARGGRTGRNVLATVPGVGTILLLPFTGMFTEIREDIFEELKDGVGTMLKERTKWHQDVENWRRESLSGAAVLQPE